MASNDPMGGLNDTLIQVISHLATQQQQKKENALKAVDTYAKLGDSMGWTNPLYTAMQNAGAGVVNIPNSPYQQQGQQARPSQVTSHQAPIPTMTTPQEAQVRQQILSGGVGGQQGQAPQPTQQAPQPTKAEQMYSQDGVNDTLRGMKPPSDEPKSYDDEGYRQKYGRDPDYANGEHGSDEFKRPNHITFSTDSKYSKPGQEGGVWKQDPDGTWSYTPSAFVLSQHTPQELQKYFAEQEPKSKLILPPEAEVQAGRNTPVGGVVNGTVQANVGGKTHDLVFPMVQKTEEGFKLLPFQTPPPSPDEVAKEVAKRLRMPLDEKGQPQIWGGAPRKIYDAEVQRVYEERYKLWYETKAKYEDRQDQLQKELFLDATKEQNKIVRETKQREESLTKLDDPNVSDNEKQAIRHKYGIEPKGPKNKEDALLKGYFDQYKRDPKYAKKSDTELYLMAGKQINADQKEAQRQTFVFKKEFEDAKRNEPLTSSEQHQVDVFVKGMEDGRFAPSQLNTFIQRMGGGSSAAKIRTAIGTQILDKGYDVASMELNYKARGNSVAIQRVQLAKTVEPIADETLKFINKLPKDIGFVPANEFRRTMSKYMSNDDVILFEFNKNKMVEEFERMLTGSQMADSRVQRNLELIRTGFSKKALTELVNETKLIARTSTKAVSGDMYPTAPKGTPAPARTAPKAPTKTGSSSVNKLLDKHRLPQQ